MRGSRTPDDKVKRFREEYLICGIPSKAGKAVGLPESTAYKLGAEAWKDPEFTKAWGELRALDVPALAAMVVDSAKHVAERIQAPDLSPQELAQIAIDGGLKSFSYQNPKPQYFRGLVQAFDTLAKPREANGEQRESGPAVVINIPPDADEPTLEPDGSDV